MKIYIYLSVLAVSGILTGGAHAQKTPSPSWAHRAQQAGNTPLRKKAYQQLALLPVQGAGCDSAPARTLQSLGMDALPVLAEALGDTTPTKTPKEEFAQKLSLRGSAGPDYVKVNEIAATLISRITEHTFVLGASPRERVLLDVTKRPDLAPAFQKIVLAWYGSNHSKTLAERKMQDINDPWFRNRLDAAQWIGTHKLVSGKSALEHYTETLLARKTVDTLTDTELAYAALALGQLEDKSSLPLVQRVHDRFHGYAQDKENLHSYYRDYIASDKMPLVHRGLTLLGESVEL